LVTQQASHRILLENFDSNVSKLLDTPLHPALVREMDRLRSEAESSGQQSTIFNNGTPT
jgi:phage baseplate assembly protein W